MSLRAGRSILEKAALKFAKRLFRNMKIEYSFEPSWTFCVLLHDWFFKGGIAMKKKVPLVGLLALAASAAFMPSAMAVPNGLPQAHQLSKADSNIEQVRWVCNPWGHCWWRPNFYGAYAYDPPPPPGLYFGRPWWHRRWHYWW